MEGWKNGKIHKIVVFDRENCGINVIILGLAYQITQHRKRIWFCPLSLNWWAVFLKNDRMGSAGLGCSLFLWSLKWEEITRIHLYYAIKSIIWSFTTAKLSCNLFFCAFSHLHPASWGLGSGACSPRPCPLAHPCLGLLLPSALGHWWGRPRLLFCCHFLLLRPDCGYRSVRVTCRPRSIWLKARQWLSCPRLAVSTPWDRYPARPT